MAKLVPTAGMPTARPSVPLRVSALPSVPRLKITTPVGSRGLGVVGLDAEVAAAALHQRDGTRGNAAKSVASHPLVEVSVAVKVVSTGTRSAVMSPEPENVIVMKSAGVA